METGGFDEFIGAIDSSGKIENLYKVTQNTSGRAENVGFYLMVNSFEALFVRDASSNMPWGRSDEVDNLVRNINRLDKNGSDIYVTILKEALLQARSDIEDSGSAYDGAVLKIDAVLEDIGAKKKDAFILDLASNPDEVINTYLYDLDERKSLLLTASLKDRTKEFFKTEAERITSNGGLTENLEKFVNVINGLSNRGYKDVACFWVNVCERVALGLSQKSDTNGFSQPPARASSAVYRRIVSACPGW